MTHPATVANWRGHAARVQQYFEQGEVLLSKGKNLLVVTAALKILGIGWWGLLLCAPFLIAAHVAVGYWWVRRGWYAHNTEIGVLEQWTPISRWQAWMTIRMYKALGLDLTTPLDRLPEEFTRVMASTQRGEKG